MTDEEDMGLEFGDLQDDLESASYPLTTDEVLEKFGDREIGTESGPVPVRDILGPSGEETYSDASDVHQAILTMVGEGAEGRLDYSDRGTSADQDDPKSI